MSILSQYGRTPAGTNDQSASHATVGMRSVVIEPPALAVIRFALWWSNDECTSVEVT